MTTSKNLWLIIEYINNNIRYGSTINIKIINDLLEKYPITDYEKFDVYQELEDLYIKLEPSKYSFKEKWHKLLSTSISNYELRETDLDNWFKEENISCSLQKIVRKYLGKSKYIVVNDISEEKNNFEELDFEVSDVYSLDDLLDNEDFKTEVSSLENVVNSNKNVDYLTGFQSKRINSNDKYKYLSNLVEANEKLVYKIALRYRKFATVAFDLEDMCQVGMLGLMKAAEKFDISLGFEFSTYSTYWIRQAITRNIANLSTTIRIPVHRREEIIKLIKAENDFLDKKNYEASEQDLSKITGFTISKIHELEYYKQQANLISMDKSVNYDESSYIGNFISDEKNKSTKEIISENMLKVELNEIFKKSLNQREQEVLLLRFGLQDGKNRTLQEIGEREGVSRERIRQIESKALNKLRKHDNIERLKNFYYDRR